jgi:hypothetical protein
MSKPSDAKSVASSISRQASILSSKASSISHKASAVKVAVAKRVRKSVQAIARPFKKTRRASFLSSHAVSLTDTNDHPALTTSGGEEIPTEPNSDDESLNTPEKKLGESMFRLYLVFYWPHTQLPSNAPGTPPSIHFSSPMLLFSTTMAVFVTSSHVPLVDASRRLVGFVVSKTRGIEPQQRTSSNMLKSALARSPLTTPWGEAMWRTRTHQSFLYLLVLDSDRYTILIARTPMLKCGKCIPLVVLSLELTVLSAHLVKWITESNRPVIILQDRELRELLSAGRPTMTLPSSRTISRDITACYEKCRKRISKLLRVRCATSYSQIEVHFRSRTILASSTLLQMLGLHRTIVLSWPGLSILSMRDICFHFSLILSRFHGFVISYII